MLRARGARHLCGSRQRGPQPWHVRSYAAAPGPTSQSSNSTEQPAGPDVTHPEPYGPHRPPPRDVSGMALSDPTMFEMENTLKIVKHLTSRTSMIEEEIRTVVKTQQYWTQDAIAGAMQSAPRMLKQTAPHIPEEEPALAPTLRRGRDSHTVFQQEKKKLYDDQVRIRDEELISGRPANRKHGPNYEDFMDGTIFGREKYMAWKQTYHELFVNVGSEKAKAFWSKIVEGQEKHQEELKILGAKLAADAAGDGKAPAAGAAGSAAKPAPPMSRAQAAKPAGATDKPAAKAEESAAKPGAPKQGAGAGAKGAGGKPGAPEDRKKEDTDAKSGAKPAADEKKTKEGGAGDKPAGAEGAGAKGAGGKPGASEDGKSGAKPGAKPAAKPAPELKMTDPNVDPIDEWVATYPSGNAEEEYKKYPGLPLEGFHKIVEEFKEMLERPNRNDTIKQAFLDLNKEFKMQEGERVHPSLPEQFAGAAIEDRARAEVGTDDDNPVQVINRSLEEQVMGMKQQLQYGTELPPEEKELHEEIVRAQEKTYAYMNDWSMRPIKHWWEAMLYMPIRLAALIFALPVRMVRSIVSRKSTQQGKEDMWTMPNSGRFGPMHYISFQLLRQATLQQREERYLEQQGLVRPADQPAPFANMSDEDTLATVLLKNSNFDLVLTNNRVLRPMQLALFSLRRSISRLEARTLKKPELVLPELPAEIKDQNAWNVIWMSMIPNQKDIPEPIHTGEWWHPRGYTGQDTMTSSSFREEKDPTSPPPKPAAADAKKPAAAADTAKPAAATETVKAAPLAELHAAAAAPLDDETPAKAPAPSAATTTTTTAAITPDAKMAASAETPITPAPGVPAIVPATEGQALGNIFTAAAEAAAEGTSDSPKKPEDEDRPHLLPVPYAPAFEYHFEDHSLNALPLFGGRPAWQSWPRFLYNTFHDWVAAEVGVPGGVRFSTYMALRYNAETPERLWAQEEIWQKNRRTMPFGTRWMNRLLYWDQWRLYPRPEVHWRDFNNVLWLRGVEICKKYPTLGTTFFDIRQKLKPVLTTYFRGIHLMDPDMTGEVATPQHIDYMFKTKEEIAVEMPPASGPILHVMNQTLIRRVFKISVKSLSLWNDVILISTSCVLRTRPWMRNMETGETLYGGPKRRAVFKYFVKLAGFPNLEKPGEVSWKVVDTELFAGKARRKRKSRRRRLSRRRFQ